MNSVMNLRDIAEVEGGITASCNVAQLGFGLVGAALGAGLGGVGGAVGGAVGVFVARYYFC